MKLGTGKGKLTGESAQSRGTLPWASMMPIPSQAFSKVQLY